MQPGRKALRSERRHAVRGIANQRNSVPEHPFGGDAAVKRVLRLQRASALAALDLSALAALDLSACVSMNAMKF